MRQLHHLEDRVQRILGVGGLDQEEALRTVEREAEPLRPSRIDGVLSVHVGDVAASVDCGLAHDQGERRLPGAFGAVQEYRATFRQTAAEAPVQGERSSRPELGRFVGGGDRRRMVLWDVNIERCYGEI